MMNKHVNENLLTIVKRRDYTDVTFSGWKVGVHETKREHIRYNPNTLEKCAVSVKGGVCA